MIRAIFVILWVLLMMLVSLPLFLISWIIGKKDMTAKQRFAQNFIQFVFKVIIFISGIKLTVKGLENVPKDRSVLYISNHRSNFDIPVTYSLLPSLTGIFSKESVGKLPVFKQWMVILKCLFISRDDTREALKTVLKGIEYMKSGTSMLIYPEGTRGISNTEMRPFKDGSFKLSTKTNCPVVPIAITNTSAAFEDNNAIKVTKCHVIIEFGKPIEVAEMTKDEQKNLAAYTQTIISEMLLRNVNEI